MNIAPGLREAGSKGDFFPFSDTSGEFYSFIKNIIEKEEGIGVGFSFSLV